MRNVSLTPKEIVTELDKYIVGQKNAKKSVAVALRNRYRRSRLEESIRDEIIPKNILMIGPTGVGKTEIARRLAKIANAPFIKVEATKFTEVGYVGRDVEAMVRDLVETSIRMVKSEMTEKLKDKAENLANERLVSILVPNPNKQKTAAQSARGVFFGGQNVSSDNEEQKDSQLSAKRSEAAAKLHQGELEDEIIEIDVEDNSPSMMDMLAGQNNEQMGMNMQELFGNLMPKKNEEAQAFRQGSA